MTEANDVVVGTTADLPVDESLRFETATGHVLAVFHTVEGFFALDDTCPHRGASLADGWVEDGAVACPLHASRFDLTTGDVEGPPAKCGVSAYVVRVIGEDLVVDLSSATRGTA